MFCRKAAGPIALTAAQTSGMIKPHIYRDGQHDARWDYTPSRGRPMLPVRVDILFTACQPEVVADL